MKCNILHTVRSLRIDGVVKVVLRNVRHLDSSEFRHYVASIHPDEGQAHEFRAHGIEPVFVGHSGLASAPASIARLIRIIRDLEIDVVHTNRTLDLALAGVAAKRCGVPVVSSLHWLGRLNDHPESGPPTWARHAESLAPVVLNRWLARRIVAVSGAVRDSFAEFPGFPTSRVVVVYPGLDADAVELAPEERVRLVRSLGVEGASPIILNVGRLERVKGQRYLIPMMRSVRERLPGALLLVAGDGEERNALASMVEGAGLGNVVRFIGARSDVDALLAISDLLVLSSDSEAAPLPLFEAMRAGKPIVATNVGGVPEIVEQGVTGYIVPRADPAAMADGVVRALAKAGCAERMGAAGHQRLLDRFLISKSTRALEQIYRELAAIRVRANSASSRAPGRVTQ